MNIDEIPIARSAKRNNCTIIPIARSAKRTIRYNTYRAKRVRNHTLLSSLDIDDVSIRYLSREARSEKSRLPPRASRGVAPFMFSSGHSYSVEANILDYLREPPGAAPTTKYELGVRGVQTVTGVRGFPLPNSYLVVAIHI